MIGLDGGRSPAAVTAWTEYPSGAPGAVHDQKQLLRKRVRVPSIRLLRKLAETVDDGSFAPGQ